MISVVFSQVNPPTGGGLDNLVQGSKFSGSPITFLINTLMPYLLTAAGIVLFLYLIFGGYTLMFSGGNPQKTEEGKNIITNALFGMVIIFASFWIVQIVAKVLGLETILSVFNI